MAKMEPALIEMPYTMGLPPAARKAFRKGPAVPARPTITMSGLTPAICLAAGSTSRLTVPGVVAMMTGSSFWRAMAA